MQPPRLRFNRRWLIFGAAIVAVLLVAFVIYPRWNQAHMLGIVREWGRLAPIPNSARGLEVTTEGNMFTRGFRASFSAPGPVIEQWLSESPGTSEVKPERPSPTSRKYLVRPGGGAQHAEVTVDDATGIVSIYVYWS